MSLHLDITAMLEEAVGRNGASAAELDELRGRFATVHRAVVRARDAGELPFWDLPFDREATDSVEQFAAGARERFRNFVLLGIGGSALGPIALHRALNHPEHNLLPDDSRRGCRFFCPDNVDPDLVAGVLDVVAPGETLFNVVSKSGGTAETATQFLVVLDLLRSRLGDGWRDHLVLTTDPEKGLLRRFAAEQGVRAFPINPGVGGRFSVLTPVGLLPAALTGIDIGELCRGAGALREACLQPSFDANPAAQLAGLLHNAQLHHSQPIHVVFAYSNRLYYLADWFRQLWAESLGKRYAVDGREVFTGPTPVKAVGATDQHSQVQLYVEGPADKAFLFLGAREFAAGVPIPDPGLGLEELDYLKGSDMATLLNAERRATAYALTSAGRPTLTLELDRIDPAHVGAVMYLLEAATVYAGGLYEVNPLDQPGVEAGKLATYALMGRKGYEQARRDIESFFGKGRKTAELKL